MSDTSSPGPSLPLRIVLKTVLNVLLVWLMAAQLNQYFQLDGGAAAYVIVGVLITLMNMFVRPLLEILTLPFKLFANIIAIIIVNGGIVQLVHMISLRMDPALVRLEIFGGLWGWIVVAVVFGFSNWLFRFILKPRSE